MSAESKIIYRPSEHADEYIIFVEDLEEYEAWKKQEEGAKTIALARFIGNFAIYKSITSGHTGQLGEVSKQDYENAFFPDADKKTDKSVEAVIKVILQNGKVHKGDRIGGASIVNKNPARGGHGDQVATGASQGSHR